MKTIEIGIVHNYRSYQYPRIGKFRIDANEYDLTKGWMQIEKEYKIIGEDDDCYIYRLQKSECGYWNENNQRWIEKYILPIGIHKTRLISWTSCQLELF